MAPEATRTTTRTGTGAEQRRRGSLLVVGGGGEAEAEERRGAEGFRQLRRRGLSLVGLGGGTVAEKRRQGRNQEAIPQGMGSGIGMVFLLLSTRQTFISNERIPPSKTLVFPIHRNAAYFCTF